MNGTGWHGSRERMTLTGEASIHPQTADEVTPPFAAPFSHQHTHTHTHTHARARAHIHDTAVGPNAMLRTLSRGSTRRTVSPEGTMSFSSATAIFRCCLSSRALVPDEPPSDCSSAFPPPSACSSRSCCTSCRVRRASEGHTGATAQQRRRSNASGQLQGNTCPLQRA